MHSSGKPRIRVARLLCAILAGGTLCGAGSCQTRVKELVVAGTQDYLASWLTTGDAVENILSNLQN